MSARRVWWLVSESGSERSNEMKRTIKTLTLASLAAAVVGAGVVYSGVINVGADDPHFPAIHALLNTARERSIAVRARDVEVPNLADEKMIRSGAGNYNSMCIGCHLAPGVSETELSQSLYPAPPDLSKVGANGNPAATFWIIKHGIKASGMPAWGKSMGDEYIWGMVAFLEQLPKLDAQEYQALVASSAGHQHGGGETIMHDHEGQHNAQDTGAQGHHEVSQEGHHVGEMTAPHHGSEDASSSSAAMPPPMVHTHADGKEHVHGH